MRKRAAKEQLWQIRPIISAAKARSASDRSPKIAAETDRRENAASATWQKPPSIFAEGRSDYRKCQESSQLTTTGRFASLRSTPGVNAASGFTRPSIKSAMLRLSRLPDGPRREVSAVSPPRWRLSASRDEADIVAGKPSIRI